MDRLTWMASFIDVVDAEGFSAARRISGTSVAVYSKRVRQLEGHLGIQLLHRTTRSMSLTEAGQRYAERCREVLAMVDDSDAAARAETTSLGGRLRVTMPPGSAHRFGAQVIAGFCTAHPRVFVDLDITGRLLDLAEGRMDVAIRLTRPTDSSLIARRLGPVPFVIVASPGYLERWGTPSSPADLLAHRCIQDTHLRFGSAWPLVTAGQPTPITVHGHIRVNDPVFVGELARRGAGIALVPRMVVEDLLETGALLEVLAGRVDPGWSMFAVTVQRRHLARRTQAFLDWVARELRRRQPTDPPRGSDLAHPEMA